MITKERYYHKPTYESLRSTLRWMKNHMVTHRMKKLSIPRIGAGLDRLDWNKVVEMIHEVFRDTDIHITVYVYVPPGFGV